MSGPRPGRSPTAGEDAATDGESGGGWTVQILPDGGRGARSLHVSRRGLRRAGLLAAVLLLSAVGLGLWLGQGAFQQAAVSELRQENRSLRAQVQAADRTVNRLAAELDRMTAQEERFRMLAGLPQLDPELRRVGIGGPGGTPGGDAPSAVPGAGLSTENGASLPLDQLLRRADLLHASLREAADSMAAHRERFLSRPSIRPVPEEISWISSGFSYSREHPVLHVNRPHTGVDVSAPRGAPIRATANGRVLRAGHESGYGKVVEIHHGHGFRTVYAHAAEITVRRGERVERGDVIGRVGETGLTSGPNVHYEVHVEGRPVNPYRYFVDGRVPQ